MKSLIRLALLIVAGVVLYNLFFGNEEEKRQSKEIINTAKDAGKAVWNFGKEAFSLLKTEKDKFSEGKYDDAVDKVGDIFDKMRGHAETLDNNRDLIARLDRLERERKELERKINTPAPYGVSEAERKKDLERDWDQLMRETETLMRDLERR